MCGFFGQNSWGVGIESWHLTGYSCPCDGATVPCKRMMSWQSTFSGIQVWFGCFQKEGYAKKWMVYNGKTLLEWMIWGYHYFRKHPFGFLESAKQNQESLKTPPTWSVCKHYDWNFGLSPCLVRHQNYWYVQWGMPMNLPLLLLLGGGVCKLKRWSFSWMIPSHDRLWKSQRASSNSHPFKNSLFSVQVADLGRFLWKGCRFQSWEWEY